MVAWFVSCVFFCVVAVFVVGVFDGRLVAGLSVVG